MMDDEATISAEAITAEIFDMVRPASPGRITLQDLLKAGLPLHTTVRGSCSLLSVVL